MTSSPNKTLSNSEEVIAFLDQNMADFIADWEKKILVQAEPSLSKIRQNFDQLFEIIKNTLRGKNTEDAISHLAYKVAKERVGANSNIGDFVHNVNSERSTILNRVMKCGLTIEQLDGIIETINAQFDLFCYQAVSNYTELREQELQKNKSMIKQAHQEKMAILGQMSSSFVHEFRNPLTSIIGFNKLLQQEYPNLKYLDIIELELDQLKFRITQFLHTSKLDVVESKKEDVKINILLNDTLNFLYPSIVDVDVNIRTNIQPAIIMEAQRDELKQVFLNILFNSIDAVRQREKPREISVTCYQNQNEVIVQISNNGPMIPADVKETIFEPFYTTKDLGTGIGLFVCKNIIDKHRGSLTCQSDESETTFNIYLPLKIEQG